MERPLSSPNLEGLDPFSFQPHKVEKPWGHELIWAKAEDYAGKLLFVRAGQSLSLQFHRKKDESWHVLEGRAELRSRFGVGIDELAFTLRLQRDPALQAAVETWLAGAQLSALDWEQRKQERLLAA